jgi:mRNA interferase MazF
MTELRRGAVVLVRLDPAEGSEIRKTRPAVVLSNEAACRFDAVVQVVPLTDLPGRQLRPYEARVDSDTSGVDKPSRAVANQLRTIAKQRIVRCLGMLSPDELRVVEAAVLVQLGVNCPGDMPFPRRSW